MFCEMALALGMASGICARPEETVAPLPEGDAAAWSVDLPPEPEPLPPPALPPVVIVQPAPPPPPAPPQIVVREKIVEKPVEKPAPKTAPAIEAAWAAIGAIHGGGSAVRPLGDSVEFTLASSRGQAPEAGPAPALAGSLPAPSSAAFPEVATDGAAGAEALAPKRYKGPGVEAGEAIDNRLIMRPDRYIIGVLETSINSQLESAAIIQVAWDVYGYHGDEPIIPKGSRFICETGEPKVGQTRLSIDCTHAFLAETAVEIFEMGGQGGDGQGRAGTTGDIDNRFADKYGASFILAGISGAVRLSTALTGDSAGENDNVSTALNEGSAELSQQLGEISASILEQTIDLEPIVTIPQGTVIAIRPKNILYFQEKQS